METFSYKNFAWDTMGGDNQRIGRSQNSFSTHPKLVTKLSAKGRITASPVFNDDNVTFIADMSGLLQAFSPEREKLWEKQLQGGVYATPALDQANIYVATLEGKVYAFNHKNGELVWQTEIPSRGDKRILSHLLVLPQPSLLVLNSWGGKYKALDTNKGDEKFEWDTGSEPYAPASATNDGTIFCMKSEWARSQPSGIRLLKVDPASGKVSTFYFHEIEDKSETVFSVLVPPVIDEEHERIWFVTVQGRESFLRCHSLSGDEILTKQFSGHITATPSILNDGSIVLADMHGTVHCFNEKDNLNFRYFTGADYLMSGTVCSNDNISIICDTNGVMHVISQDGTGAPFHEANRSIEARPAFDRYGNLIVPTTDGEVYIFSAS